MGLNRLDGKEFGKLIVTRRARGEELSHLSESSKKKAHWLCNCHCGTKDKVVQGANLVSGRIISCGCVAAKKAAKRARERFEIDDSSYIDYETEGF